MPIGIGVGIEGVHPEVASFVANTSITILNPALLTIPTGTGPTSQLLPTIVTLASGAFIAAVLAGQRFRITSGASAGDSALINSVDSGTVVTLRAAISVPPASFASLSWEVVIDPQDSFPVESTLEWSATGSFYMDGVLYRYASKTVSTFDGIEHYDGAFYQPGAKQQHETLALADDFTRVFSAIDIYRRSFLVEFATGRDLDVVGGNVGVDRPAELSDDDLYRALIKAIAYAPRGTVYSIELALDALFGETLIQTSGDDFASASGTKVTIIGTFDATIVRGMRFRLKSQDEQLGETVLIEERISATEIRLQSSRLGDFTSLKWEVTQKDWIVFEDLTLGSINHGARIYAYKAAVGANIDPNGRAFLEDVEVAALTSPSAITISTPILRVVGLTLKDEGWNEWDVASGASSTSADSGVTITGPASSFPTRIAKGDIFQLTDSRFAGLQGVVISRDSDTQITIGHVEGAGAVNSSVSGALGINFSGASWKIIRPKSNVRFYKPSAEVVEEYPGDSGSTLWAFDGGGGGVEGTDVAVTTSASRGAHLELADNAGELVYRRVARIEPESVVHFEVYWDHDGGLNGAGNALQMAMCISDSVRAILFGVVKAGGDATIGFCDENGTHIGTTSTWETTDPGFSTFLIKKNGAKNVQLWWESVNAVGVGDGMKLVAELPYADFATIAAWQAASNYTAGAREIAYGNMESGAGHKIFIKHVDWYIHTAQDYWNTQITNGASNVDELSDNGAGGLHLSGDVTKAIRVSDWATLNASDGNPRGEWEIAAYTDADTVDVIGPTRENGKFTSKNLKHFIARDIPDAFRWPDHLGHSVEILSGANAGVFPILSIVDPVTEANVAAPFPGMDSLKSTWTDASKVQLEFQSNIVELDTVAGTPSLPDFVVGDEDIQWRIIPNFANDAGPVVYEIVDTGTDGGAGALTLRSASPFPTGTVMAAARTQTLTGQLRDKQDVNAQTTPPAYDSYPFYLFDNMGFARRVVDMLTAAGVIPGFETFNVDDAGPHILE